MCSYFLCGQMSQTVFLLCVNQVLSPLVPVHGHAGILFLSHSEDTTLCFILKTILLFYDSGFKVFTSACHLEAMRLF